jgi:hypothetical protein
MLLALRNVERAAAWLTRELRQHDEDGDINEVLVAFHEYLPGLVSARNALEHFDEYAVGRGRLQRGNPVPYDFELHDLPSQPVVTVGPLVVPVRLARDACRFLVISLLARVPLDEAAERKADALLDEVMAKRADQDGGGA